MTTKNDNRNSGSTPDLSKIEFGRTREGNMFEAAALLLIVALWTTTIYLMVNGDRYIIAMYASTPELAADAARNSCGVTMVNAIVGTLVTAVCLLAAYRPAGMVNVPFRVRNVRQLQLMSRSVRVSALGVALLLNAINLSVYGLAPTWLTGLFTAMLLAETIGYCVVIYRAGRRA